MSQSPLDKLPADMREVALRFLDAYDARDTMFQVRYNPTDDLGFDLVWGSTAWPHTRFTWWRPSFSGWYVVTPRKDIAVGSESHEPFPPCPALVQHLQEVGTPHPLYAMLTAKAEKAVVAFLEAHGITPGTVDQILEEFRPSADVLAAANWVVELQWGRRGDAHPYASAVLHLHETLGCTFVGLRWSSDGREGILAAERGRLAYLTIQRSEDFAKFVKALGC